jgi:hypothetical protein
MAASLMACVDGEGFGQSVLAGGITVLPPGGPTGQAVLAEPPWTIAKRVASRAVLASVSFAHTT